MEVSKAASFRLVFHRGALLDLGTAIVGAPNANSLFIYTMELANDDDTTSSANQGAVYGGIIGGVLGVGVIGGAVYFGVMGGGAKAAVVENTLNPVHGV